MILKNLQEKLKEVARAQSVSYQEIGKRLSVSEATVKRIFNHEDVSFSRLEQLCHALEVSLFDVIELTKNDNQALYQYSHEQELFLAQDKKVFLLFRYLIMGKEKEEIRENLMMDQRELQLLLRDMEKIKLIERHPEDRIKMLANFPFKWIPNGPLESKFGALLLKRIVDEALQNGINRSCGEAACFLFEWGISAKSHELFVRELSQVYDKYKKVAQVEIKSLGDEFIPTSGMISIGKYPIW